jgi:DNA repair protein RadA/Sms
MPKLKTVYVCQQCGAGSPKWMGQCPACEAWNSLVEEAQEIVSKAAAKSRGLTEFSSEPVKLSQAAASADKHTPTGVGELDRVLGGGILPGQVILLAGPPGIGKSTLLLQAAAAARASLGSKPLLYVSGEESLGQVSGRAARLGVKSDSIYLLSETNLARVLEAFAKVKPALLVVDSIQTVYHPDFAGSAGTVGQIRECAGELLRAAKTAGVPLFILGHVTKEGSLAGPKVLEHIVDTVLYFDSERDHVYRILRAHKNRFGPVDEIGIFEMTEKGLDGVPDAGRALAGEEREAPCAGRAFTMVFEGSRPLLLEVQALAARSYYPYPRRAATGMDLNRVQMLIAALEKRAGLRLDDQDVFASVQGGIKVKDPVIDLAFCAALISSALDIPLRPDEAFLGEVGILAQTYPAPLLARRLTEAARLGFKRAYVPPFKGEKPRVQNLEIISVPDASALRAALEKATASSKGDKK